jgi:hypothetical protein
MQQIRTPWSDAMVLVCGHEREPGSPKPSCGLARASELRQWLKDKSIAEGWKGRVSSVRTGCLGVCSPLGVTVAVCGVDAPKTFVVDPVDDREALWGAILGQVNEAKV